MKTILTAIIGESQVVHLAAGQTAKYFNQVSLVCTESFDCILNFARQKLGRRQRKTDHHLLKVSAQFAFQHRFQVLV